MASRTDAVPDRMTAVVLHAPGDWSVETVETPALGDVENVVCRVRAVAICGSDPKMMTGRLDWPPRHPFIPGHEWAGEVVAVGDDVERFAPGDRIFGETHSGCGFCRRCRAGEYNLCEHFGEFDAGHRQIGHTLEGAFAEYVSVPDDLLSPLPEAIDWPEAALLDVNAIALHCTRRGRVGPGDTVAVFGTGIIGLCCVQQARAMGASEVVAVGNPRNNELAADLGATHTIPYDADDVAGTVRDLTGGRGVDVALEAVGVEASLRAAVESTRKAGTVSVDGMPAVESFDVPVRTIVKHQLDVRGCRAHANLARASARLVVDGRVDLSPLVSREFPLEAFEEAYETFTGSEGGVIRVVLRND